MERPGMYGIYEVRDLESLLMGYELGIHKSKLKKESDELSDFKTAFRLFVNQKCDSDKNYDWARLIEFHSGNNRHHTLTLFKMWFSEFIQSSDQKSKSA